MSRVEEEALLIARQQQLDKAQEVKPVGSITRAEWDDVLKRLAKLEALMHGHYQPKDE